MTSRVISYGRAYMYTGMYISVGKCTFVITIEYCMAMVRQVR
jgi:hypothetical protein